MTNRLTIYNLSVCLETNDFILKNHINNFLEKYYTIKQKSFSGKGDGEDKVYASKIRDKSIWQLHTTQFIHLYQYLKEINYPFKLDEKIDETDYKVVDTNFKARDNWVLKEKQVPVYEFLINDPVKSKLIPLVMGAGKTSISLISIAALKKRLAIVILPTFIEKWVSDICQVHEAASKDVMVIQGSKSLAAIIAMAKEGELKHNYYIFSSRTMQDYISAYEDDPESCIESYGCSPIELMPLLGIGILLNDEAHMNFHSIFKILIYSNVKYQIGLSATLLSEDHTTRRVHKVVYPDKAVYGDNLLVKYADVYPIAYSMSEDYKRHIKTTNYGSNNYSHIAFEQSILRRDRYLHLYYKLIKTTIDDYYINDYKENDKVIIFVSTVNLATKLTEFLKDQYPDKIVNRYCEDDDYEDLMTAEMIVSTVISAGTGVDIPNLRVGIQTVCISSPVSNLQSFGRLRQLPDRDVKFCYTYCNNIPKQKQYHLKRVELFSDRAANIIYRQSRVNFI